MHSTTRAWPETLAESVRALGEAALDLRLAHRRAEELCAGVTPQRRQIHPGIAHVAGSALSGRSMLRQRRMHEAALLDLGLLYNELLGSVYARYERAALVYATGCAWAIAAVQSGATPDAVVLTTDATGACLPGQMEIHGAERWPDAGALATAYQLLLSCRVARGDVEDLTTRQTLITEPEYDAFLQAQQLAEATADAAYDYAGVAERALTHVLADTHHAPAQPTVLSAIAGPGYDHPARTHLESDHGTH